MGMLDSTLQSSSSASLLGVLVVLLIIYFISSSFIVQENKNGPPGPRPLPLLGNLLLVDLNGPFNSLLELSKKYGPVFTVWLGPKKVVVLAGYKTVKEALVNHADTFGERDPDILLIESSHGNGVTWSNGDSWKEMRRFALSNLRDYGMGKRACEDKIIEECHYLTDVLKNFGGEAFDTTQPINYAVSNIICSLVYGSRFEYDDPEFTYMVDRTDKLIRLLGTPSVQVSVYIESADAEPYEDLRVYNIFPWMCKWMANRREVLRIFDTLKQQKKVFFKGLKETFNPQMCRGLVDAFLVRQQQQKGSGITDSHFHSENLLMTVIHLFTAGTGTTATTLRWGLMFMAKYPKIQDQVQEEISRVIGTRQVQVEDRKNLPFTDAVIHETQRLANIVPMALPHKTSEDITFQGYVIEKGTTVYPLLTSVLYDETEWEKPHSFHPAHFLDEDGKFVKRDAFMPFSAGRRACLGESLARMELFLFFTTLLHNFRFTPPPGIKEEDLGLSPRIGLTLSPSPHKLCAVSCL